MTLRELDKMEAEVKRRAESGESLIFPLDECLEVIEDLRCADVE